MPTCWLTWALTCEAAEVIGQSIAEDLAKQNAALQNGNGDDNTPSEEE